MVYFIATIYFWKVSKDWYNIVAVGYFMTLFACFGSFLLPESPRLLVELKRIDEAKLNLDTIARWNKKHLSFYLNDFLVTAKPDDKQADSEERSELQVNGFPNKIEAAEVHQWLNENLGDTYSQVKNLTLVHETSHVSDVDIVKCLISF